MPFTAACHENISTRKIIGGKHEQTLAKKKQTKGGWEGGGGDGGGGACLRWLAEESHLHRIQSALPRDAALVRHNVSRDAPFSPRCKLAELQGNLLVKLFHDNVFEIRRQTCDDKNNEGLGRPDKLQMNLKQ